MQMCLMSMVQPGRMCHSIIHIPLINKCYMSKVNGRKIDGVHWKKHHVYLENVCVSRIGMVLLIIWPELHARAHTHIRIPQFFFALSSKGGCAEGRRLVIPKMFSSATPLLLVFVKVSLASPTSLPNIPLLECFEYKKNFWIVGHAFHTTSVQFKDDCLRVCLTSSMRGSKCLSAMHVPNDEQCVISDQDQTTKPDLFVENDSQKIFTVNYFRNRCAEPPNSPGAGRLEARLMGFKGGEGKLELAQVKGRNPIILVIITGLHPNRVYDIIYAPEVNLTKCHRAVTPLGEKLVSIETDNKGMAIQPWKELEWHILDDNLLDKTVLVVDQASSSVADCGALKIVGGNLTTWTDAKNSGALQKLTPFLIFISVFLLF